MTDGSGWQGDTKIYSKIYRVKYKQTEFKKKNPLRWEFDTWKWLAERQKEK